MSILDDIGEAIRRVTTGSGNMRIPAEPHSDPDLVLGECRRVILALLSACETAQAAIEYAAAPLGGKGDDGTTDYHQDMLDTASEACSGTMEVLEAPRQAGGLPDSNRETARPLGRAAVRAKREHGAFGLHGEAATADRYGRCLADLRLGRRGANRVLALPVGPVGEAPRANERQLALGFRGALLRGPERIRRLAFLLRDVLAQVARHPAGELEAHGPFFGFGLGRVPAHQCVVGDGARGRCLLLGHNAPPLLGETQEAFVGERRVEGVDPSRRMRGKFFGGPDGAGNVGHGGTLAVLPTGACGSPEPLRFRPLRGLRGTKKSTPSGGPAERTSSLAGAGAWSVAGDEAPLAGQSRSSAGQVSGQSVCWISRAAGSLKIGPSSRSRKIDESLADARANREGKAVAVLLEPRVPAELKLREVAVKVVLADRVERADEAALDEREHGLGRVGVRPVGKGVLPVAVSGEAVPARPLAREGGPVMTPGANRYILPACSAAIKRAGIPPYAIDSAEARARRAAAEDAAQ